MRMAGIAPTPRKTQLPNISRISAEELLEPDLEDLIVDRTVL
jgi:hypothetical protein